MVTLDRGISRAAAGQFGLSGTGRTLLAIATVAAFILSAAERAFAQAACPAGLVVVNGTECAVTPGTVITVAPADAEGLTAINPGGKITADSITLNLNAARTTGALALQGGEIILNGGTIQTISAGAAANMQIGVHSSGPSSKVTATGSSISVTSNGNAAVNASGARASAGGQLNLDGVALSSVGSFNHGLLVSDVGSVATLSNTNISQQGSDGQGIKILGGTVNMTGGTVHTFIPTTPRPGGTGILLGAPGSAFTGTDVTVITEGAVSHGVLAQPGAAVTLNDGIVRDVDINTNNRDSIGLSVAGSTLTATNVDVLTTGIDNSHGVASNGNSQVTLIGGTVTTTGNSVRDGARAIGLIARNPGATLEVTGTTIVTRGTEAFGVNADDGGTITLNNVSVRTEDTTNAGPRGGGAIGLFAVAEQQPFPLNNPGANPAIITGTGVTVETLGPIAYGVLAQARNDTPSMTAAVDLTASSVTTHGDGAVGLRAVLANYGLGPSPLRGEAVVTATDSAVVTSGVGAHGALARDNPASVTLNNTTVTTSGAVAHGTVAEAGGLIVGNAATVSATGANASALYAAGAPTDPAGVSAVSVANFTGSSLTNVSGPTIGVGGVANITLTNSTAGGSGQWLRVGTIVDFPPLALVPPVVGIADTQEDPDAPPPPGAPAVPAPTALPVVPGLATITLDGSTVTGSAFTAPGSVSNVTMVNGSLWNLTGSSNLTNLTNADTSLIDFSPPVGGAFKTLTVVNYIGAGGTIGLNTFLGNDSSPSDKLVIDGGTGTGNSFLRITNAGGAGALTVANGILVVDAINGATTVPGAFALAGPVLAGPYEYLLFRSSRDATAPESWFLRSTIDCALAPADPACAIPVPGPGPAPPAPLVPNFRQEVSLYAALPALSLLYGRTLLDTLHERVGEEEHLRFRAGRVATAKAVVPAAYGDGSGGPSPVAVGVEPTFGSPYLNGAWGRVIAQSGDRDGDRIGIFGDGPKYDFDFIALQAGLDVYRQQLPGGYRTHAGLYGALGDGRSDVTHFTGARAGRDTFTAYTGGGYLTLFGPTGLYLDGVVQGTFYDMKAQSTRIPALETDGWGLASSLEAGVPWRFGGLFGGLIVEPQAQLVYQSVDLDTGRDIGAIVRFDDVESLAGRLGVRFATTWAMPTGFWGLPQPGLVTAWFRPNYWHEFSGSPRTSFSSETGFIPFQADLGEAWVELNSGISARVDRFTELYANGSYQFGVEGDSDAWGGKVGLRVNW